MRRPPTSINNSGSDEWKYHEWQVMTYAWLRSQQLDAKPLVAGIVFYFNELYPSRNDLKLLKKEIQYKKTDIIPHDSDLEKINSWEGSSKTQPE